jgi:hypothetical protein
MKPETKFRQGKVIPFLKTLKNTAFFPIQQQTIRGDADFFMVVRGRFVWLELKTSTGKEEPLQKLKRQMAMEAGAIGIVATPDNWANVKKWLELLSQGEPYVHSKI